MIILNLLLVISGALFGGCLSLLPPMDFLCRVFNVTLTQLQDITDNFNFQKESAITNDIKFYQYITPTNVKEITNFESGHNNTPTKIIVHGWQSSANEKDASVAKIAQNYHTRGELYNVIAVDWSKHSKTFNYPYAARLTMSVGELIGDFILANFDENSLGNIHLIGHSLGAHVMGFAGKNVMVRTKKKIGRITGLDPAAPLFEYPVKLPEGLRLSKEDATFVDVIHTNAGFFGVRDRYGTADFYVEGGGPIQPPCLGIRDVVEIAACSHYKSVEYFEESISGRTFRAVSCPGLSLLETLACDGKNTAVMGEDVEKSSNGIYQLNNFD